MHSQRGRTLRGVPNLQISWERGCKRYSVSDPLRPQLTRTVAPRRMEGAEAATELDATSAKPRSRTVSDPGGVGEADTRTATAKVIAGKTTQVTFKDEPHDEFADGSVDLHASSHAASVVHAACTVGASDSESDHLRVGVGLLHDASNGCTGRLAYVVKPIG